MPNQFTIPAGLSDWMSQDGYQYALRVAMDEAASQNMVPITLPDSSFVYVPEPDSPLSKKLQAYWQAKFPAFYMEQVTQDYLQAYYSWTKDREEEPVQPPQEPARQTEDVVAAGLAQALESILSKKGRKYDRNAIGHAIHILTRNPSDAGVIEALQLLCLKKGEKKLPAARVVAAAEKSAQAVCNLADQIKGLTDEICDLKGEIRDLKETNARQAEEIARLREQLAKKSRMGRKSEFMERQSLVFRGFLSTSTYEYDGTPPYEAANACWNKHRAAWNRAVMAVGKNKGYSSYKALADAYHNSVVGRK